MCAVQKNITLGTAGHIDHGKTVLVKCLTGCDTDRLKAEKQRGMSIELGFAPCRIADMEVGIVDVPGHENFIKTMVAGASGVDGVIFVIAADDGVMPQTREHLDILTLLGVKHGIVALTKVDCIEQDHVLLVTNEIKRFLEGTFLENAPILPLSGITGEGLDAFYDSLKKLVNAIKPKGIDGVFRLPVERTFSLKGYGTVVTGIAVSGSANIGDEVVLLPQATKGRIRAIQVYNTDSSIAVSGQCAALNVPQWDYKTISRGNVVAQPGSFSPQQWYLCSLKLLTHDKLCLKTGTEVKFHTGTAQTLARIYLLEGSVIAAGQEALVQARLSEPVVAGARDCFILRTLSPVQTIGGGMIIEPIPRRLKRNRPEVLEDVRARASAVLVEKDFVEYCVKTAQAWAVSETDLSIRTKVLPDKLKKILAELIQESKVINIASKLYIHKDVATRLQQLLLETVRDYHHQAPESPGINPQHLLETSRLPKPLFDGLVAMLTSQGKLVERKHCLALPRHRESFSENEKKLLETIEPLFRDRLFNPPQCEELMQHCSASREMVERILRILVEHERLDRVGDNLFFHCQAIERARKILVSFINKQGQLESVKFKYLLGTTRKFAIPLLDYFDRVGVTRRVGNTRYLKMAEPPT